MDINAFLSILLYIAAIVLIIVFIIVGIKLVYILDKVDKITDDVSEKMASFDGAITTFSKAATGIANISNTMVFGITSVVSKIFNKKMKEEDK